MTIQPDRLHDVIDQQAISDVAIRYCWALDENDWGRLDEVFLPDATARLGNPDLLEGREAIVARVTSALTPLDDSQHIVSNHQVTIDGDSATHRCYLHAQHIRRAAQGGPHYVVAGRYVDRLVRTDDGWRISHRDLEVMWTEGNVAVVRGDGANDV
jgi:SnoaL-like domain